MMDTMAAMIAIGSGVISSYDPEMISVTALYPMNRPVPRRMIPIAIVNMHSMRS